jgi:MFS family permease
MATLSPPAEPGSGSEDAAAAHRRAAAAKRPAQLASAALFVALGFNYGTWTSRLPAIKAALALDTSQVSLVLLAGALGAVFSFPVTAWLLHRFGSRGASLVAGGLLPLVLLALGATPSLALVCATMVAFGIVASALDVAMNAQGVEVERRFGEAVMSRLHAGFSLGTMAGALFASAFTWLTPALPLHFGAAALLMWLAVAWTRRRLVPDAKPVGGGSRRFALAGGAALWLGAIALLGMIVEGSMIDWATLYMRESAGASVQVAPLGIASVQGSMLVARWFGDGWRVRYGARRLLVGGALVAGIGLGAALLIGGIAAALVGFALVGVGVAAISPCVYAAGAQRGAVALASVTTLGSAGALVGPPLIGGVAQHAGLPWGMAVIAMGAFLMAPMVTRVKWDG